MANPLHGVESVAGSKALGLGYKIKNPLHGVESYMCIVPCILFNSLNPLHGVERSFLLMGHLTITSGRIHCMELKALTSPGGVVILKP